MKSNKKAFTIVELVIVIAVIAILAAVLIPTFSNLIKRSKVSADQQLIRNLNSALRADLKDHKTMTDALAAAEEFGYNVSKINKSATDNEILWDSKNDVFCYFESDKNVITYIPETTLKVAKEDLKDVDYWVIAKEPSDKYSTYLFGYVGDGKLSIDKGLDVGNETVTEVKYTRLTGASQDAIIRTNGGTLIVNAPGDNVYHYGLADSVNIIAVASASYHENGTVPFIQISQGRIEIEATADVNGIHIANVQAADGTKTPNEFTGDVTITLNGADVKLSRDVIGTNITSAVLVCKVEASAGASEYIWLVGDGTLENAKVYVTDSTTAPNTEVASTTNPGNASKAAIAIANNATDNGNGTYTAVEAGVSAEEAKQASIFKGEGTNDSPYVISNTDQWNSFYQAVYDFNKLGKTPYFVLSNDIDLTNIDINNFAYDGESQILDHYMNFILDGSNYTVKGISSFNGYKQILPYMEDATVKNITFNYDIDSTKTLAMSYSTKGSIYFTNVTVTGEIRTSADWATAFVAYSRSGNIYYTNCTNMANIKGGFGNNSYVAAFGSHNGGGVHITFDNCKNYGGLLGGYVGFVGMGNDSVYTFIDSNAVQNYGSMNGTKSAGYFNYDSTAESKTISGITCEVKKGSSSASKATSHTNTLPANFGDSITLNEVVGATKYEVEMSFSVQVFNYDDGQNANKWSGGFPRSMKVAYTSDDVVNGKITTVFKKGYVGEIKASQYHGYQNTTPTYDNGVFLPDTFDISKANIVLNQGDIYLVEENGKNFYVFYSADYPGWYSLLTTDTAGNVTSTQVTVSFSVTAYNPDGSVLSFSSFSYGSNINEAKDFFN